MSKDDSDVPNIKRSSEYKVKTRGYIKIGKDFHPITSDVANNNLYKE